MTLNDPADFITDHKDYDLRVMQARINAVSKLRPTAFVWNVLISTVCVALLWSGNDHRALILWWLVTLVFSAWRVMHWFRHRNYVPATVREAHRWFGKVALASTVAGLIWAYAAFFFLNADNLGVLVFFLLVLLSVANGGVIAYAAYLPAGIAFAAPIAVAAACGLLMADLDIGPVVALGSMTVFGFMVHIGRNYAASVTGALSLSVENSLLLHQASEQQRIAERANEDRSRFFAAVSHDLRQPLYAMGLVLESLGERLRAREQKKLHEDIERMHRAITDIFNALLDVAHLDTAAVNVSKRDFELSPLVSSLIEEFLPSAEKKNIRLRFSSAEVWVNSDPLMFARIVRNLLSNAIKFSESGVVEVSAQPVAEGVMLCVRDQGCGIPFIEQQRIFDDYYQVDREHRGRGDGLGLGLAVVKRLCELLNIEPSVHSAPGSGSEFRLRLPVGSAASIEEVQPRSHVHAFGGLHVLVIDDDDDILESLGRLLRDHQCRVTTAKSASESLSTLDRDGRPVDILLCDFQLGAGVDGFKQIQLIRDALDTRLPALLITGDTDPAITQHAASLRLTVLHKPLSPDRLFQAIVDAV